MNITIQRRNNWRFLIGSLLASLVFLAAWKPDDESNMIEQAKEAADQSEKEAGDHDFEVKTPSDDHLTVTEEAAGEADERNQDD